MDDPKPLTLRDGVRVSRNLLRFLGMVWQTHRRYAIGIGALRFLRSCLPLAALWIGKLIMDAVVESTRTGEADWPRLATLVGLEFGIAAVAEVAVRTGALWESLLGDLFSNRLSLRLMEHAARLDLQHFEDPAFYDRLERARQQTVGRVRLLSEQLSLAQNALTLVTLMSALIAFSPLLCSLLVIAVLPSFLGETHFAALGYSMVYQWTPERRRLDYYRYVAAADRTAKEVKLFGLSAHLIDRFRVLADRFYEKNRALATRRSRVGSGLAIVSTSGYYAAYATILGRTIAGSLSLGDLTLLTGSFQRSRELVQHLLLGTARLYDRALYLDDLFAFLAMKPTIRPPAEPRPVPRMIRSGIEFREVWFRYPLASPAPGNAVRSATRESHGASTRLGDGAGSIASADDADAWVLSGVSFRIPPGGRLALVGENGAGKTTLIKLLMRLYEPTRGTILLDGRPLAEYDPNEWRREVGVIFQDFVRWDMTAAENIAVGRVAVLGDPERARPEIEDAAERSLAAGVIAELPHRYDTMLGRRFEGGVDLSGGQWQKVALARAYMRHAQVLVLDEPTAALDARAEYQVFQRFADLTAGKIAILISHRFSTVRMADRIVVLEGGRLLEEGSHSELIACRGRYQELFDLQAAGYR